MCVLCVVLLTTRGRTAQPALGAGYVIHGLPCADSHPKEAELTLRTQSPVSVFGTNKEDQIVY